MLKRLTALLLCLMLVAPAALAGTYQLQGMMTPQKAWLEALGDGAGEISALAQQSVITMDVDATAANIALSNAQPAFLRLVAQQGRTLLMVSDTEAVVLLKDYVALLNQVSNLEKASLDYQVSARNAMGALVEAAPENSDIYNSMFTTSRFLELDGEAVGAMLALPEISALLPMTGYAASDWVTAAQASGSSHAEITVYQANSAVYCVLDITVEGMPCAYISYMQDAYGLTLLSAVDTQPVTDWDETLLKIDRGQSDTGRRADAFVIYFDDDLGRETYLEYAVTSMGKTQSCEVSFEGGEVGELSGLNVVIRRDGTQLIQLDFTIAVDENAALQGVPAPEMITVLEGEAAQQAYAQYISALGAALALAFSSL